MTLEEEIKIDLGHCYQQLKPYFISEDEISVEEIKGSGEFGKLKKAKMTKSLEPSDASSRIQTDVALKFIKGISNIYKVYRSTTLALGFPCLTVSEH